MGKADVMPILVRTSTMRWGTPSSAKLVESGVLEYSESDFTESDFATVLDD